MAGTIVESNSHVGPLDNANYCFSLSCLVCSPNRSLLYFDTFSFFFLPKAGFVLLCLAFAIFGISEVPEGGVQFDATHFEDSNFSATSPSTTINPTYVPPPPAETTDIEKGEGNTNNDVTTQENSSYVQVQPEDVPTPVEPVDLLDNVETGSSDNKNNDSGIHELD